MKTKRFTIEYPEKVWVMNKSTATIDCMEVGGIEVKFKDGKEVVSLLPVLREYCIFGYLSYPLEDCFATKKELLRAIGASIEDFS